MTNTDVVMKLVGKVNPVGESHTDTERFENLVNLCELTVDLLVTLRTVAKMKNQHQHSIKYAGNYADNFLKTAFKNLVDED